ncbi:MAG: 30S ribosomal protein S1 [Syntrophaceae bacterium PtaB.Bin095]|nr:MAG: 30S ribosomal protein S1 [Syntrophaceae bacterium PtaB.Bin095]
MDQNEGNTNQPAEEQSFAELFEKSEQKPVWLKPGEKVEARIVKISPDWVFLDLGGKNEGYLDRKELLNEEGELTVREGDTIRAYFLSSRQDEKLFTTKIGPGDAGRIYLEDAWRNGIPVEGLVEKEVKGGFEIRISGTIRGFCPFSQMGLGRIGTPADYTGKRLQFIITEYGERGRNVILSNRVILERERQEKRAEMMRSLQEGQIVRGKVVSLQKFGAFVDIGGMQGLLPMSEIGWGRIENINDALKIDEEVEVAVLKIDREKDRISLSLKKLLADPWEKVESAYPEGSVHSGRVVRLTKFGAFIALEPGIDGLLHISRMGAGKRVSHAGEVLKDGQDIEVKIEKVDRAAKRISLLLAEHDAVNEEKEAPEDYRQFMKKTQNAFGSLGDQLKDFGKPGAKGNGGR